MRPTTHLYYSWTLGYALLYDDLYHLVARAELEDDRHWLWGPDYPCYRVFGLPRNLPQLWERYLARKGQEDSRQ